DGLELVIKDVEDLTIMSEYEVELQVEPRYACVLNFEGCEDITLQGITMGHTDGEGYCSGAVLNFSDCDGVDISGMDLYGCGTYGIWSNYSYNITVDNTIIRDCSYGTVNIVDSSAEFNNCSMYGCVCYDLFDINDSTVSFSDCEFYDNSASEYGADFITDTYDNSVIFNNCSFGAFETSLYNAQSLDPDLYTFNDCTFDDSITDDPTDVTYLDVDNLEDFLDSIYPYTYVTLASGTYVLSDYINSIDVDEVNDTHDYVNIEEVFDGYEVLISDVPGLTISGGTDDPLDTEIQTDPRYADVLAFINCSDVSVYNMTLGHTDLGQCSGDVLSFNTCSNVELSNLDLYGCGVYGVYMESVDWFNAYDCHIHDCEYGPICTYDQQSYCYFNNCVFDNSNAGFTMQADIFMNVFDECTFGEYESQSILYNFQAQCNDCVFTEFKDPEIDYYGEYFDINGFNEAYVGDFDYVCEWFGFMKNTDGEISYLPIVDNETFENECFGVIIYNDGTGVIRDIEGVEYDYFEYEENENGNFLMITSDTEGIFDDEDAYIYFYEETDNDYFRVMYLEYGNNVYNAYSYAY
ncbi:MAG: right-handed parallel beta-helix repeat-containing protein, partial [Lachnospiraceae bacterium]|nr:right-handed parallel beta-helix repeat-containing protein [Lachnospiraceae bacterium]